MSVEQDIFRPWRFFSVKFISSTNINYGVLSAYCFKSCQYGLISSKILSNLGFFSLIGRAFCCKISWSIEAARFGFKLFQSLWNLTGASAAALLIEHLYFVISDKVCNKSTNTNITSNITIIIYNKKSKICHNVDLKQSFYKRGKKCHNEGKW